MEESTKKFDIKRGGTPKISVIIPVYNVAPYLKQCLNSIVRQSLRDIEIICVDDASTDNSWDILQNFAQQDDRFYLIENKANHGAAYCRNLGLEMACGEYLAILDADDFFDLTMLEKGYKRGIIDNADLVYWRAYNCDEKTGVICDAIQNHFLANFVRRLAKQPFNLKHDDIIIYDLCQPAPWYKLHRKKFVEKNQLTFQNLVNSNDVYFGKLAPLLANKICFIDEPLVYHRKNRVGQITAARGQNPECAYRALLALKRSLDEKQMFNRFHQLFFHFALMCIHYAAVMSKQITGNWDAFLCLMQEDGWRQLDMIGCQTSDFILPMDYRKWQFMVIENNWDMAFSLSMENFITGSLIHEIKKLPHTFFLWGFGRRGKKFFNVAQELDLPIVGIIDKDETLRGAIDGCPILPLAEQQADIDVVILTNSAFFYEVRHKLQNSSHKNALILDVEAHINYGASLRDCIFKM